MTGAVTAPLTLIDCPACNGENDFHCDTCVNTRQLEVCSGCLTQPTADTDECLCALPDVWSGWDADAEDFTEAQGVWS